MKINRINYKKKKKNEENSGGNNNINKEKEGNYFIETIRKNKYLIKII